MVFQHTAAPVRRWVKLENRRLVFVATPATKLLSDGKSTKVMHARRYIDIHRYMQMQTHFNV